MRLTALGYGSIARQHMRALGALRERAEAAQLTPEWVMGRVAASAAEFATEFGIGQSTA